jgi:cytochrome c biogenesis protein CcmG, thiol:disulfide interchange protein DsbE
VPLLCATVLAAGCGGDPVAAPGGGDSSAARSGVPQGELPRPLAEVRAQANELLEGGAPAFEARLSELEGHPVVVNKWASWCDPCRAEFPFFRSQAEKRAGEVAFLGLNSLDNDEAAAEFLESSPVPYPSYTDQDQEVANEVLGGNYNNPATAFFDERGELVYVKQGGYSSEQELAEDIERYAG